MENPEICSSHLDSEMHDSTGEDDGFLSMLRRAREDPAAHSAMLSAIVNHDLSTLNLPAKVEARLSGMLNIKKTVHARSGIKGIHTFLSRGQDDALIAEVRRKGRKLCAESFRRNYTSGSSLDLKISVLPSGTYQWTDNSSGIPWVGVHGIDSICVVTRAGYLDLTRVHGDLKYLTIQTVLRKFRNTVISEIEDLASPSSELCNIFGQSIPKPFGVVSVVLGTDNAHNESCHEASSDEDEKDKEDEEDKEVSTDDNESIENMRDRIKKRILKTEKIRQRSQPKVAGYDEKKTIKYLQKQMRRETTLTINEAIKTRRFELTGNVGHSQQASNDMYDEREAIKFLLEKMKMRIKAFTVDETIKTAISAFQHLFQKEFKANEIEVSVMDPNYFVSVEEADYKDIYVKHLETSDIEDHLAAINEPGSGGSLSVGPEITFVKELEMSARGYGSGGVE